MKIARNIVAAGTAGLLVAVAAGAALAVSPALHTLTVNTPDGGTAEIKYAGDVAPTVTFKEAPSMISFPFGPQALSDPGFADLQKMSIAMDRQMDDLMSRLNAPGGIIKTGGMSAGTSDVPTGSAYTMVSTRSDGGKVCTQSVEVSRATGDKAPRVVTRTSGDCKTLDSAAAPAASGGAVSGHQSL